MWISKKKLASLLRHAEETAINKNTFSQLMEARRTETAIRRIGDMVAAIAANETAYLYAKGIIKDD